MNRSEQFDLLIVEYLDAHRRNQAPSRGQMIARHPDFADELNSFFDNQEALAGQVPLADPAATLPPNALAGEAGSPHFVRYFGDYELLEEVARGGMGVVFKARQVSLNRIVALKMILAGQFASPADVQRFRLEAEAAANLDHPNILPIYEVGEHEGQQYFSMKYVDCGTLAGRIRKLTAENAENAEKKRSSAFSAVQVLITIARAVHFAHQRGIIHRDLKPGNILLDTDDTPFVADFGLAKRIESDSQQTQTGAIVGTPTYMAPEQARSEKQLTTAVDVYALGAILYEIIAGQPPFAGPTPVDVIMQVLGNEPTPPSKVKPSVDRDLATIAMKCLEKAPDKRYESAAALADDLDRWQRGEPITARPISLAERGAKWVKRNRAKAGIVATAALVVLLVGVGWPVISRLRQTVAEQEQAVQAESQRRQEAERTAAESESAKQNEQVKSIQSQAETLLRQAQLARQGEGGSPTQSLNLIRQAATLRATSKQLADQLSQDNGAIRAENNKFWANMDPRLNDEAVFWLTQTVIRPTLSQRIKPAESPAPQVVQGATVKGAENAADPSGSPSGFSLSADGKKLARIRPVLQRSRELIVDVIELTTGSISRTARLSLEPPKPRESLAIDTAAVAFAPDDELLLAVVTTGGAGQPMRRFSQLIVESVKPTGEQKRLFALDLSVPTEMIFNPAENYVPFLGFSADCGRVLYHRTSRIPVSVRMARPIEYVAQAFDVADGKKVFDVTLPQTIRTLGWNAAGDRIITTAAPQLGGDSNPTQRNLDFRDASGSVVKKVNLPRFANWTPGSGISADMRWLVCGNSQQNAFLVDTDNGSARQLPISSDERMIYVSGRNMRIGQQTAFCTDGTKFVMLTTERLNLISLPDARLLGSVPLDSADTQPLISGDTGSRWLPITVRFLTDGRLATATRSYHQFRSGSNDDRVQIWEYSLAQVAPPALLRVHSGSLSSIQSLSNDRKSVIAANDGISRVDFSKLASMQVHGQRGVEFRTEVLADRIPWGGSNPGPTWMPETRSNRAEMYDMSRLNSVIEQPDFVAGGQRFLNATSDMHGMNPGIKMLDPATGRIVWDRPKSRESARSIDGRRIALMGTFDGQSEADLLQRITMTLAAPTPMAAIVSGASRGRLDLEILNLADGSVPGQFRSAALAGAYRLQFSPDGQLLIGSGSENTTVVGCVADGSTIKLTGSVPYFGHPITDANWTRLATIGPKSEKLFETRMILHVYELPSGQKLAELPIGTMERDPSIRPPARFSSDGKFLAFAGPMIGKLISQNQGFPTHIWKNGDQQPRQLESDGRPVVLAEQVSRFLTGGKRLLVIGRFPESNSSDYYLHLWDTEELKRIRPETRIEKLLVCNQGNCVALNTAGNNRSAELWDALTGKTIAQFKDGNWVNYSEDGRWLLLQLQTRYFVINSETGSKELEFQDAFGYFMVGRHDADGKSLNTSFDVPFSRDGQYLLTTEAMIRLKDKHQFKIAPTKWLGFSPDSRLALSHGSVSGAFDLWDPATGRKLRSIEFRGEFERPGLPALLPNGLRFSPDGKFLAANVRGQIRIVSTESGQVTARLPRTGHASGVNAVAVHPSGQWIASAGADGTVALWPSKLDGSTMIDVSAVEVRAVKFTADGKHLITVDAEGRIVNWQLKFDDKGQTSVAVEWDVKSPEVKEIVSPSGLAVSAVGSWFAVTSGGKVVLANIQNGTIIGTRDVATTATAVSIAPNGKQFAVGNRDGLITIFDRDSNESSESWNAEQGTITGLEFHPDGTVLASSGQDLRLWNPDSRQRLLSIRRSEKPVRSVAWSRDGHSLLTTCDDATADCNQIEKLRQALKGLGLGW